MTAAGAAAEDLAQPVASVRARVDAFYGAPCDPRFRPADGSAAFTPDGYLLGLEVAAAEGG